MCVLLCIFHMYFGVCEYILYNVFELDYMHNDSIISYGMMGTIHSSVQTLYFIYCMIFSPKWHKHTRSVN